MTIGLGGGMTVSGTASADGTRFLTNTATRGGGAFLSGTLTTTQGALFSGNRASQDGGGVNTDYLVAVYTQFVSNTAGLTPTALAFGGGLLSLVAQVSNT